ncbi:DUF6586 family protein [Stutzerimonas urumqiensis]|uniref:DUF6586 family protein n=1 Tax=Stutzerimonas urumqiensis TaxID=638269 RepID=UPI000EABECE9|nr:DUF6586 family protein [Stutzerimonas urumqiensis]
MAKELYTRTNQKVFFAGLALEAWRKAEAGNPFNALAVVQAEREAALFHLYGALLGLCHEVAGYYRTSTQNAARVEAIICREALDSAPSPELAELVELAEHPQSWLSELLTAYAALFQPPKAPAKPKTDPRVPVIEVVAVEEAGDIGPSLDDIERWRASLKELALRFRQSMTEW